MIETSNGLRCIRSHWQYYSRSTAPARQRKTKANCRRNRSKMASYKCCGTGPNQTTFSQTDCCKLPKEISGNKAGNGRKKKKKLQQWQLCHATLVHQSYIHGLQAQACNMEARTKQLLPFKSMPTASNTPPWQTVRQKDLFSCCLRDACCQPVEMCKFAFAQRQCA